MYIPRYYYDGDCWEDCVPPPKTMPTTPQPSKPAPLPKPAVQPKPESAGSCSAPLVKLSRRATARKLKAELKQLDTDMQALKPQLLAVRPPAGISA
jgi:hypothetical protein